MKRFTVVSIKRDRADYVVEAADARDAWNRVALVESMPEVSAAEYGVTCTRQPMLIEHERFVIEVPEPQGGASGEEGAGG